LATSVQDPRQPSSPPPAELRILLEIVRSALKTACKEMGRSMMRTAWSPIFNEGLDLSCMIFDHKGEMLAQGDFCPSHIGATVHIVEWAIKEVGAQNFEPGDVVLHNDPYRGGCHLPEFLTLKPIFVDGHIEGYAACIAHMVDVGGKVPGSFGDTKNIFEEGLRMPPVKVYRRDEEVADIFSLILANVRMPQYLYGDMKAMIGSLYTAERRVLELIERYGAETYRAIGESIKDTSELLARERIKELPDGEYHFAGAIEDDGVLPDEQWVINATVVVRGDEVIVDYTGSSRQSAGPANQTWAVTASGSYAALFHLYPNDLPLNAGAYRPITVIAPPGTFVNVDYPGSCVGGNTDSMPTTIDVVLGALSEVAGQGTASDGDTWAIITLSGIDPRTGESFTLCYYDNSGGGARWVGDGNDGEGCKNGNTRRMPVEVLESRYPIELLGYGLNRDPTGRPGAGEFRGGFGTRRWFRVRSPEVSVSAHTNRNIVHPWGSAGGDDGGNCEVLFRRAGDERWQSAVELFGVASPGKFSNVALYDGDEILVGAPGGGGYGAPRDRDPAAVLRDVADRFYSVKEAREIFGVVIEGATVDEAATARARASMGS
jgi:N-methylhydantoinase B